MPGLLRLSKNAILCSSTSVATREDLECPILFTNGRAGTASNDLDVPGTDIRPLVDAIISGIPAANRRVEQPFTMQVNQLGYDDYVGRLAVGRLYSGEIKINTPVKVVDASGTERNARIANIFGFKGTQRFPLDSAQGGDIVAIAGVGELNIGDTISLPEVTETFEPIEVDEPTVSMVFRSTTAQWRDEVAEGVRHQSSPQRST